MGIVIAMQTKTRDTKSITGEHSGQRYTCTFDPNAPKGEQWVWHVDYVVTYRYVGSANTAERAAANARRKIHALNTRSTANEC